MDRKTILIYLFLTALSTTLIAGGTRLLRSPDISEDNLTFVYANDIWLHNLSTKVTVRLTTFPGAEFEPHFSPDGKTIAFTGEYDGNQDVYTLPVEGGEPVRVTWHPGQDVVRGWTPDGSKILFASGRTSVPSAHLKLWTVSPDGGFPEPLPVPRARDGKMSPDGSRLVYRKIDPWESEFRYYRGGQNNPIRIIDLTTYDVETLPWDGANDKNPVWVDDTIYFLSDRDYVMNIWAYHTISGELKQVTFFKVHDCKNLEMDGKSLVFENEGYLYLLSLPDGEPIQLSIDVEGDFPWARPHWVKADDLIMNFNISPTGKRALFSARGDIFTVPAEKGDTRNLTNSSDTADRAPAWSPDGDKICWFSDQKGEYELIIADQFGKQQQVFPFKNPTFYYSTIWSPDSKMIAFTDNDRNLLVLDCESGDVTVVDDEGFAHPHRFISPVWSPDSKWITYTKRLTNQFNAVFIYSIESGKTIQLTDGMSDCISPAWDKEGKTIYFLASTEFGPDVGWLDLSSLDRPPVNRSIYMAILKEGEPSPLLPESDEEAAGEDKEDKDEKKEDSKDDKDETPAVEIDFKNIDQRIISLGLPEGLYQWITAGEAGVIYYTEKPLKDDGFKLHRYTLKERESKELASGLSGFRISYDGKKVLYRAGKTWGIVDGSGEFKSGDGKIATESMSMKVIPSQEWQQIFREAWRYQRDYFYVDNVHGLDMDWTFSTYKPWVSHVRHRNDLTYILDILGGETSIGHSFTGGGDEPDVEKIPVGLLGADLKIHKNRYKIEKIYTGENWNPDLRAPLSEPGVDVKTGDYILAVNGKPLYAAQNPYSLFDQTVDRQTVLTVNDNPDTDGAREITVVPVRSEYSLRQLDWINTNQKKVDKLSGGKLAYVWLPNTGGGGYSNFVRYFFAQQHKKGAIIDERFNTGGLIADYVVDMLSRDLMGYFNNPVGNRQPFTAPNAAIWGPKVLIINESAGSGGDMLPYMFRRKNIGPLVGTRTWGGLVGIWDVPQLIDGGYITAPRGGFYNTDGEWDVENKGVEPDIVVEQDPKLVNQGHDPQLEKAVEVAMELLKEHEVQILPQPPDPVRIMRPLPKKEND